MLIQLSVTCVFGRISSETYDSTFSDPWSGIFIYVGRTELREMPEYLP